jgi:lipid A 4'-phosphatase
MGYLKLRRSQVILASFLLFSLFFVTYPGVDISISRIFFHGTTFLDDQWWQKLLHEGMGYFLCLSMVSVVALYACNRIAKRRLCNINGKRVLFLFLVLTIGAGLIVNAVLKDNFGRARPRDIAEFGGTLQFTPPFVVSGECAKNCSFASGEAAGGFFSLALALALSKRRALYVAAIGVGVVVSLSRIAAGAHFFSDAAVSFFVMLIVADVLYFYIVLTRDERDELLVPAFRTAVLPATRRS